MKFLYQSWTLSLSTFVLVGWSHVRLSPRLIDDQQRPTTAPVFIAGGAGTIHKPQPRPCSRTRWVMQRQAWKAGGRVEGCLECQGWLVPGQLLSCEHGSGGFFPISMCLLTRGSLVGHAWAKKHGCPFRTGTRLLTLTLHHAVHRRGCGGVAGALSGPARSCSSPPTWPLSSGQIREATRPNANGRSAVPGVQYQPPSLSSTHFSISTHAHSPAQVLGCIRGAHIASFPGREERACLASRAAAALHDRCLPAATHTRSKAKERDLSAALAAWLSRVMPAGWGRPGG